jgi:hypothetical protein
MRSLAAIGKHKPTFEDLSELGERLGDYASTEIGVPLIHSNGFARFNRP